MTNNSLPAFSQKKNQKLQQNIFRLLFLRLLLSWKSYLIYNRFILVFESGKYFMNYVGFSNFNYSNNLTQFESKPPTKPIDTGQQT